MNKNLLVSPFLLIMIGGFALGYALNFGTVQAATEVIGTLTSNTTWTKANSPYILTGNVLVNNGVTLTIEAGVTVNFVGYYIAVNGTLVAVGSTTNQITFTGGIHGIGPLIFTQYSTSWDEQTGLGSIIENANGVSANITNVSPKIANSSVGLLAINGGSPIISYNNIIDEVNVYGGTPLISNNNFNATNTNNCQITIYGGSPIISHNNMTGTLKTINGGDQTIYLPKYGIKLSGDDINAYISNNTISGHNEAGIIAISGFATIERNFITNGDHYGISILGNATLIIQNNTITNNHSGIGATSPSSLTITHNNIENNTFFSIFLGSTATDNANPNNVNAANNWWGTTDTQTIDQTIYDSKDDYILGTVTFVPFLTEPNPQAMPEPNAIIPTSSASPSSSPTPSPSANPISSPSSQSPTATPDQSNTEGTTALELNGIEIALLIAVIVLAVLLSVSVALLFQKKR